MRKFGSHVESCSDFLCPVAEITALNKNYGFYKFFSHKKILARLLKFHFNKNLSQIDLNKIILFVIEVRDSQRLG